MPTKKIFLLLNRLENYLPIYKICHELNLTLKELRSNNYPLINHFKDEGERDKYYDIGRINYFIKTGVASPILIVQTDSKPKKLDIYDGNHRYIAAVLRNDQYIMATFSGNKKLEQYLIGNSSLT